MTQPKRKALTQAQRMAVYEKCQGHCAYCGTEIAYKQMQVDHVTPMEHAHFARQNGKNVHDLENLLPACRPCNYIKSSMFLEKFREIIPGWVDVLHRDSVTYRNAVRFGMVTETPELPKFYFEKIGLDVPDYTAEMNQMYREAREMLRKKREEAQHDGV